MKRERETDRQRQREKQMSSTLATTDNPICGLYFKDNVTYNNTLTFGGQGILNLSHFL